MTADLKAIRGDLRPLVFDNLRWIASEDLILYDILSLAPKVVPLNLLSRQARLSWLPRPSDGEDGWQLLGFSIGTAEVELWASRPIGPALLPDAYADSSASGYDTETELLLIEHALTPLLDRVEGETGLEVRLEYLIDGVSNLREPTPLAFELQVSDKKTPLIIEINGLPQDLAKQLARALSKEQELASPHLNFDFEAQILSSAMSVIRSDVELLSPGDLLAFPKGLRGVEPAKFILAGQMTAGIKRRGTSYVLIENLKHINLESSPMTASSKTGPAEAAPEPLNGLQVIVSIELDRRRISLSELKNLRLGAVVPFDRKATNSVRLLADGKPLALGELVMVGETIGVQILEIL